jgi:hypothetical protein
MRAASAGLVLGFGLWALSPLILGPREPWDADWPAYPLAMLVGGAVTGWWAPGRPHWFYIALWLGQLAAVAVLPGRDLAWLPIALVSTAIGGGIGLVGYVPSWLFRRLLRRRGTEG